METDNTIYLILFIICVMLSAYFALAEIAFMSLQHYKVEVLVQKKVKGAKLVAWLKSHPERLLSTVLLGNNLVNTAAASLGTAVALQITGSEGSGILAATIVVTVILLVFGDAIPKTTASRHSEKISLSVAGSVRVVAFIFAPFVLALSWLTTAFGKIFGGKPVANSLISEEEIRTMISAGQRDGVVEQAEAEMLHKVFDFGDRPAREIMVPRTKVIWVEKGKRIADFFNLYQEHPLNRYPVFEERRDNVVGIISAKDVLLAVTRGACDTSRLIDDLIRPAYFAPESKRIIEILAEMRAKNLHMCVVVDEYGGTAGILTMTQLVEEIVGDVNDELAEVKKEFEVINETTYKVSGSMRIEDVNKETDLILPEDDYETVAGFLLKILGHIPKVGEQFKYRDLKVVVTRMDGNKIEEIFFTKDKHAASPNKV
jgi:putative hemolysin